MVVHVTICRVFPTVTTMWDRCPLRPQHVSAFCSGMLLSASTRTGRATWRALVGPLLDLLLLKSGGLCVESVSHDPKLHGRDDLY